MHMPNIDTSNATRANAPAQKRVTLRELAEEYLADAGGLISDAVTELSDRLVRDADIRVSILNDVVEEAARASTRKAMLAERAAIVWKADHAAGRRGVVALSSAMATALLDFPLGDGTRLRDATREAAASRYEKMSNEMARRGRWLRKIIVTMGDAKTVGAAIDENKANELLTNS